MRTATRVIASALLVAAPASADPAVEIEAGGAYVAFGTPSVSSTPSASVSLGAGATINNRFAATLRGHLTMGDGFITALGANLRQRLGAHTFVGYGPAIANVVGVGDRDMRATGIGLAADLRAGIRFSDFSLTAEAMPIWVFASDSLATDLHWAIAVGLALGYQR